MNDSTFRIVAVALLVAVLLCSGVSAVMSIVQERRYAKAQQQYSEFSNMTNEAMNEYAEESAKAMNEYADFMKQEAAKIKANWE